MATVSLEAAKAYARIDGDEDDALVESLIEAAEEYLAGAGVYPGLAQEALYQLAVKGIVLHWYEQRNATERSATEGRAPTDFAAGVRLIINQLKQTCQLNSL